MINYPALHIKVNKVFFYAFNRIRGHRVSRRIALRQFFPRKGDHFLDSLKIVLGDVDLTHLNNDYKKVIRELGEQTLNHHFDILGFSGILSPIEWNKDIRSEFSWKPGYKYFKYKIIDLNNNADVKFPWELNRCHHFLWLGESYIITKDEKYAKELVEQINDWIDTNPYAHSINWTCSMEVAIRAVNWMYSIYLIKDSPYLTKKLIKKIEQSLYLHGYFIYNNLEYSPVYNANHYYSNIVGLVYLGILFKDNPKAKKWLDFALNEYCHETRMQHLPSGANYENSISYHRLTTEMALCGYYCIKRANIPLPIDIRARLIHALKFVVAYMKKSGAPLIGDNDDGRFLPIIKRPFSDHSYLTIFDSPELIVWSCDTESIIDKSLVDAIPMHYICESGNSIIKTKDVYLFVSNSEPSRYVEYGKSFIPTHTHNDKLSFDVAIKGENIFIDPGTYCYTSDPSLRNEFRSTRKHNTIIVDGEEQNILPDDNIFAVTQNVIIDSLDVYLNNSNQYICKGAYSTKREKLHHIRQFVVETKQIVIIDTIIKKGSSHTCTSSFHLASNIEVKVVENNQVQLITKEGNELQLAIKADHDINIIVEDDTVSPHYGVLKQSKTIRFVFSFDEKELIKYILSWK